MTELKEKLKGEIESCDWSMLSIHHKREAVFLIDKSIPLVNAAIAIATDNAKDVKDWQNKGLIRRPVADEIKKWEENPNNKIADFIIIQPFVLIQLFDDE